MDTAAIIDHLRTSLSELEAVYLFGSRATGVATPDSDADLAVLVGRAVAPLELFNLAGDLADITRCHVDLVDLRSASTVLQYQIVTTGIRLWTRDSQAELYESFILSEKTALDEARRPLLQDIIREGRVHGR